MILSEMTTMRKLMLLHGIVGGKAVEDFASGNPCVFTTDLAKPLRKLELSLLPRQSGTGDPSPSNIRPLLPWGEVGTWLSRGIDTFVQGGIADGSGANTASSQRIRTDFIPVSVLTESENTVEIYGTGYAENEPVIRMIHFYNASKQWLGAIRTDLILIPSWDIYQSQMPTGTEYLKISAQKNRAGTDNISPDGIVLFTNKQSSHPVNLTGITPPVYGCELDLTTGEVTIECALVTLTSENSYIREGAGYYGRVLQYNDAKISNYNDFDLVLCSHAINSAVGTEGAHFRIPANGSIWVSIPACATQEGAQAALDGGDIQVSYKLRTPITYQLTPQQVSAIVGVNTVWSDADNVDVTYLKKG